MKFLTTLLVACCMLFAAPLSAQVERACTPLSEIKAPPGWTILASLSAKETAEAVELVEALTGIDDSFNFALLAEHIDGRGIILLGRDGTVCGSVNVPAEHWRALKKSIIGVEA